jgi:Family of unknown function (DUF5996)
MPDIRFATLPLDEWRPTRDTIHGYARVLGQIRRVLSPRQRHWGHVSLSVAAAGLTTTPIPAGPITFDLLLDFTLHGLVITTSRGERWCKPLRGQSAAALYEETLAALGVIGAHPSVDASLFSNNVPGAYDVRAVEKYWQVLSQLDGILKRFKGELRGETSSVQLWPHHFDLAMLWFSGRHVPGVDPEHEDDADEQMNFGFTTGDETIPEPYFYVTAYPLPGDLFNEPLPDGAVWHSQGWQGAVMRYAVLAGSDDPEEKLLSFLRVVQQAGARLMKPRGDAASV